MSNWFQYPTTESLIAGAKELGVDDVVATDSDVAPLFEPVQIGGRTVGNRLAIHPMEGCDGTADGKPGELTIRRWVRFGAGGCKLIWGEAVAIVEEGRANPRQLWLHDGSFDEMARLVETTRKAHRDVWGANACDDLLIGCQLTHSGRYSYRRPLIVQRDPALDGATLVPGPDGGKIPMPADYPVLSDDDLKRIEDQYLVAAKLAVKCGFDFLDLKQCHRYLCSELLGSHTRPGPYGGSLENRTRLQRNVFGRMRGELGPKAILGTRMNMFDAVPYMKGPDNVGKPRPYTTPYKWSWGVDENNPLEPDLREPKQWIATMQKDLGVAVINLSMGNPYSNPHFGRPNEKPPLDAYENPEHPLIGVARHFRMAAELQQAFPDLPMVGTGYSWLQHHFIACAAANVKRKMIAIAGVGRGAFAYPDFVKDLKEKGHINDKQACIAVSSCTALMRAKGNEFGQFPSGCVPKDKFYGPIYRFAINAFNKGNKPGTVEAGHLEHEKK
ncbi:MAG: NADH:flavin oxidoreductase [Planctomycetota bacterium]|nr:NADH:flavin oxidoreductase [Planctomycetota bacterium]